MTIQTFVGARDGLGIEIFDRTGKPTRFCQMGRSEVSNRNVLTAAQLDYRKRMASIVPSVRELKVGEMCGNGFDAIMAEKKKRAFPESDSDDTGTPSKVLFPAAPMPGDDDDDPDDAPVNLAAKPKHRVRFPATITERRADGRLVRRKADL